MAHQAISVGAALVGGGISGVQAALDMANSGLKVYLVDQCTRHRRQDGAA